MLDERDKTLLKLLSTDAKQSAKQLARKSRIGVDSVRYRLRRFEEMGIIKGFVTQVKVDRLGYTPFAVYFRLHTTDVDALLAPVIAHKHVSYVAHVGGSYDYIVTILARNVRHFHTLLLEVTRMLGTSISNNEVLTRMYLLHYGRDYLWKKKSGATMPLPNKKEVATDSIDEVDETILRAIACDARASTVSISADLNIPASTIAYRIKQLEKRNIISGYRPIIDCAGFGFQQYDVFLSLKNMTAEQEMHLVTFCFEHPHIISLINSIGKWDYELIVEVQDQQAFLEVFSSIRSELKNIIESIEFIVVFKEYKFLSYPF